MWSGVVKYSKVWYSKSMVKAMRTISPPTLITHQSNALTIISLVDTPHSHHSRWNSYLQFTSSDELVPYLDFNFPSIPSPRKRNFWYSSTCVCSCSETTLFKSPWAGLEICLGINLDIRIAVVDLYDEFANTMKVRGVWQKTIKNTFFFGTLP